jgi:hypothetical protein
LLRNLKFLTSIAFLRGHTQWSDTALFNVIDCAESDPLCATPFPAGRPQVSLLPYFPLHNMTSLSKKACIQTIRHRNTQRLVHFVRNLELTRESSCPCNIFILTLSYLIETLVVTSAQVSSKSSVTRMASFEKNSAPGSRSHSWMIRYRLSSQLRMFRDHHFKDSSNVADTSHIIQATKL